MFLDGDNLQIKRSQNAARNIWFGVISSILTIACQFLIRTLLIYKLGTEYLGLSSLFTSVLSVLCLADLGFGNAMVFSMYKPIATDDASKICALLNFYKSVYRVIGLIITIVGLFLLPFLEDFIEGTYPKDINLYVIYLLYLANVVIGYFLFAYKSSLLAANQRNDVVSKNTIVLHLILYIIQAAVILLFKNYYVYTILIPAFTALINIANAVSAKKMFPQCQCKGYLDKDTKREIKDKVVALFGHKVGGTITNSFDNIVISAFLGLNILAIYNNYYYIYLAISGVLLVLYNSFLGGFGNSVIIESVEKNYSLFKELFLLNNWIIAFCSACFLCLFQPVMQLWMGESRMLTFDTVILLVIYFYIIEARKPVLLFKDATGLWRQDMVKPYIEAGVNLIVNIILVQMIGINGVIISSILAIEIISKPWETHVIFSYYFKVSLREYIVTAIKNVAVTITACLPTFFACSLISDTVLGLICKFVCCMVLPNVVIFLCYRKTDEFIKLKIRVANVVPGLTKTSLK